MSQNLSERSELVNLVDCPSCERSRVTGRPYSKNQREANYIQEELEREIAVLRQNMFQSNRFLVPEKIYIDSSKQPAKIPTNKKLLLCN